MRRLIQNSYVLCFKMFSLHFSKGKITLLLLFFTCISSVIYLYLNYLQEYYQTSKWSGERCLSELSSVKYQLEAVTEYKSRIDRLLTETQRNHQADKERFKDIMESCVAMKQQSSLCQSQFEDLQSECKNLKENFSKVSEEMKKLKPAR